MRKGSEEVLHIDTGPLTLTEPMTMAASWLALEDVRLGSGELEIVPGSHSVPENLHPGGSKGHNNDMLAYGQVLDQVKKDCADRGFATKKFEAKRGDILIWHADLLHGGAVIDDPSSTRKSLVTHFMPLGVLPTFYDSSNVTPLPYPEGGYCLDRLVATNKRPTTEADEVDVPDDRATIGNGAASYDAKVSDVTETAGNGAAARRVREPRAEGLDRLKQHVPLSVKRVLREQVDWLATNPRVAGRGRSNGSR
jgi:hypothetical protein